jgi:hypothetical protein
MAPAFATITTDLLEHADGRPVAYIDATAIAVFAYQEPDGTHVIDVHTRGDVLPERMRLLLDGKPFSVACGFAESISGGQGVIRALRSLAGPRVLRAAARAAPR